MNQKIYLIGVGMGTPGSLTIDAANAIDACATLLGAPRLLEPYAHKSCIPLISAPDIAARAAEVSGPVGVLFSGDTGFFSGCKSLLPLLEGWDVTVLPGVSSLSWFAAKTGIPWQDACIVSAHGRSRNVAGDVQAHAKTFVLTGGATKAQDVCAALRDFGLDHVTVTVGERLSYPGERIVTGTPAQLAEEAFDDLSVLFCLNPDPVFRGFSNPGIPDETFLRGEVPMTKEEVRTISLSKLRLCAHHILWDIGAGTGSVSVEGGLSLPAGRVYAVEKNPAALELLKKNKERFAVTNLHLVAGSAPEVLPALPTPDRVFLGGTSGSLEAILRSALEKNPAVRVVVNAVTLETLAETLRCFQTLGLVQVDIAQVAVTKTRDVGQYHMLSAQNPVWVVSGEGRADE